MADDGGLKQLFPQKLISGIDWQRIESALTGGGIPDLNAKPKNAPEFWIADQGVGGHPLRGPGGLGAAQDTARRPGLCRGPQAVHCRRAARGRR